MLPLFHHSPALEQAYCLRQVLTGIFNSPFTKARATEAIQGWCEQVRASDLRCFDGFLTTVANWGEEITNYFGTTEKAKSTAAQLVSAIERR